ncbi:MAG: 6-phosphogluconolactonase [Chlamydiia bacterium]
MQIDPVMWDPRRTLVVAKDESATIDACGQRLLDLAKEAVRLRDRCVICLSGGKTPMAFYHAWTQEPLRSQMPWDKVWLIWGDERPVPPENENSNSGNALRAGLAELPIPAHQIHRMHAEEHIDSNAVHYQEWLEAHLPDLRIDLLLLGLGADGHIASLFPETEALTETKALCAANWVPQQESWRMTLTFPMLHHAEHTWIIALGESKADIVADVLTDDRNLYPASHIGSPAHPALWWLDTASARLLPLR